jgi:hypothetical protein
MCSGEHETEDFAMSQATATGLQAPAPKGALLALRLRPKEVIGRQGPVPNMGEVELENCSEAPLEIEYTMTPLQFLELEVLGPNGVVVSEGHFADRFSPSKDAAVLRLMPGEKFAANVSLLATVPPAKRSPGKHTIQASYCFQGRRVAAEPVTLDAAG